MMPILAQIGSRLWMPPAASSFAGNTDWLFYFVYWVSVIMFLLIMGLIVYFVIRYRHRPGNPVPRSATAHATVLELTWTIVPALVMLFMFEKGFHGLIDETTPPDYAYTINVTAYQWGWNFSYPNGATSNELHVPLDVPVKVVLASQDVIHGFFIPAFRVKKDVVPGRYNTAWFEATRLPPVRSDGKRYFDLFCTQYCGMAHSRMRAKVFVQDSTSFQHWLDATANWVAHTPPAVAGHKLYQIKGCMQCHSDQPNTIIVGPSFHNLWGHTQVMSNGEKITVNENYVRQSILDPGAKIVSGFQNDMPSFRGRIKDDEITAIIAWLQSISDKGPKPLPMTAPKAQAQAHTPGTAPKQGGQH